MMNTITIDHNMMKMIESDADEKPDFFCDNQEEAWVTTEGWMSLLRMYASAASVPEGNEPTWELLWLYVPDYTRNGRMGEIKTIPWSEG